MIGRTTRARVLAAILCSLLPLSAGGVGSVDWNLCVADDGHATLEISHGDSDCWTEVRRHHSGPQAFRSSELDHHTCTDIPIVEGRAGHASTQRIAVAVVVVSPATPAMDAPPRLHRAGVVRDARVAQALSSRRSIVLII
jgi:hypothetical protein